MSCKSFGSSIVVTRKSHGKDDGLVLTKKPGTWRQMMGVEGEHNGGMMNPHIRNAFVSAATAKVSRRLW
jgi:hypothetical protein